MKKITSLASAFALILFFAFSSQLHAQEEYRISQPISANIDSLFIKAGWNVHIKQGDKASIAIVTVCHAFFDNDNEPEVCKIEGNTLTMLENNSMPKSTVVEITLNRPLKALDIAPNAIATTQEISFNEKVHIVTIGEHASVNGSVWRSPKSLSIHIYHDASLKMDSIVAGNYLNLYSRLPRHGQPRNHTLARQNCQRPHLHQRRRQTSYCQNQRLSGSLQTCSGYQRRHNSSHTTLYEQPTRLSLQPRRKLPPQHQR